VFTVRYSPKEGSIDWSRNGVIENLGENHFLVDYQTSTLTEIGKN